MGLYERMTGEEFPRIPQHSLAAVLGEWERGRLTSVEAIAALGLSVDEAAEAATLLSKIVPPRESISIGSAVTLTNIGVNYDSTVPSQGLGVALVQTAGISQVIFGVRVNKVGGGTQSWQLWNETDGTEVAVIDDAAGTGVKTLSTTVDFSPALGAGMKVVRVRAKSTTAADDPVFLGAAISIRRVNVLTAVELHEVTMLCTQGNPYYPATALKARLGV